MADPKQDESFKIVDRRSFLPRTASCGEGCQPPPGDQDRRWEEEIGEEAPACWSLVLLQTMRIRRLRRPPLRWPLPWTAKRRREKAIESSRSFQMLVDFLTRNAAAMLGGMADPRTGQAFLDLEGAREVIDMLDALREKTRGNLAKADEDLLIEVLGSLKLTFMEISKAAAEQMKKQAGVKK